jgi:hypothetical protein
MRGRARQLGGDAVQPITVYSTRPPSLCGRVRLNICHIGKFMLRPILPPLVPSKVLGFVGETEHRERWTRAIGSIGGCVVIALTFFGAPGWMWAYPISRCEHRETTHKVGLRTDNRGLILDDTHRHDPPCSILQFQWSPAESRTVHSVGPPRSFQTTHKRKKIQG